jgi:CheB methylesterase
MFGVLARTRRAHGRGLVYGHDIVVIGASSGGVEALARLAGGLPSDVPAAVFVVMHFPEDVPSVLPHILSRAGPLEAAHPKDGDPIGQMRRGGRQRSSAGFWWRVPRRRSKSRGVSGSGSHTLLCQSEVHGAVPAGGGPMERDPLERL